jgi:hypothetical protein
MVERTQLGYFVTVTVDTAPAQNSFHAIFVGQEKSHRYFYFICRRGNYLTATTKPNSRRLEFNGERTFAFSTWQD